MASGSFNVTTNNQYIVGKVSWSSTPNTTGNYSDVYAELRLWRTNTGYETYGTGTWYLTINGSQTSFTGAKSLTYNSNTLIVSHTVRVSHDTNGSKSCTIAWSGGISGINTVTASSGTAVLDTIPRASTPTVSPTPCTIGGTLTILGHRKDASFTHKFYYTFGNIGKTAIKTYGSLPFDNDATWVLPNSLANQIPSAKSGTGSIICETYNSAGTHIGTNSVAFTASVPDTSTFKPTISTVTVAETVAGITSLSLGGKYVQSLSNVKFTISGVAGALGSTVASVKITFRGTTYTANVASGSATWTTGAIGTSGSLSYSITATDSRGYSVGTPKTGTITVLPYSSPLITAFTAKRCDSSGNLSEVGTYLKIARSGSGSSLKDGASAEKNTLACTVQWSIKGANSWSTMAEYTVSASSTLAVSTSIAKSTKTDFAITSAYDIKFTLTDKFNNTVSTQTVTVGTVMMSWSKTGVGIGKVISPTSTYALELGGNVLLDAGKGIYSNYNKGYILNDHNNGNVSVNGAGGGLYLGEANTPLIKQCRSISADGVLSLADKAQLVGDYTTSSTANKMIWTIGENYNTWATHYGIGYEYGDIAGLGVTHHISFRTAGSTGIRLGLNGNMSAGGRIVAHQGFVGVGRYSVFTWTGSINTGAYATINHNLGYYPIITAGGNVGNIIVTYRHESVNQLYVYVYSGGGGNWTNARIDLY